MADRVKTIGALHMLRTTRRLALILALLPCAVAAQATQANDLIFQTTNAFRQDEKIAVLSWNPQLAAAAQAFAEFMARTGRYGHDVDGRQPSQRAEQHGYRYCIVDEN